MAKAKKQVQISARARKLLNALENWCENIGVMEDTSNGSVASCRAIALAKGDKNKTRAALEKLILNLQINAKRAQRKRSRQMATNRKEIAVNLIAFIQREKDRFKTCLRDPLVAEYILELDEMIEFVQQVVAESKQS